MYIVVKSKVMICSNFLDLLLESMDFFHI